MKKEAAPAPPEPQIPLPEKEVILPKPDAIPAAKLPAKDITPREPPTPAELNPRQKELLEKLKTLGKITRKEYAQMFKISVPTAARDLKELTARKLLKPQGPLGPGRWYELAPEPR